MYYKARVYGIEWGKQVYMENNEISLNRIIEWKGINLE